MNQIKWHVFGEESLPDLKNEKAVSILAIMHPKMSEDDDHLYDRRIAMEVNQEDIDYYLNDESNIESLIVWAYPPTEGYKDVREEKPPEGPRLICRTEYEVSVQGYYDGRQLVCLGVFTSYGDSMSREVMAPFDGTKWMLYPRIDEIIANCD